MTEGVDTEAEINSLVRRLKSEKVDHVLLFDDASSLTGIVQAMVAQNYTPRLGTVASVQPDWMISSLDYPAEQVFAVSWLGAYSVNGDATSTVASLPDAAATKACISAEDASALEDPQVPVLLEACDMMSLIENAFNADTSQPSTDSFYKGLAKLARFESAYGVTLDFSYGRAGGTQIWDLKGDPACGCLKAVGGPYPVSDQ